MSPLPHPDTGESAQCCRARCNIAPTRRCRHNITPTRRRRTSRSVVRRTGVETAARDGHAGARPSHVESAQCCNRGRNIAPTRRCSSTTPSYDGRAVAPVWGESGRSQPAVRQTRRARWTPICRVGAMLQRAVQQCADSTLQEQHHADSAPQNQSPVVRQVGSGPYEPGRHGVTPLQCTIAPTRPGQRSAEPCW